MKKEQYLKEWTSNVNRVKNWIKRAEKRGFKVDYQFPEMPKNVSPAKLRQFQEETQAIKMYQYATYTEPETGQTVSGRTGRTIGYQKAANKGKQTRVRKFKEKVESEYTEDTWDTTDYQWVDSGSSGSDYYDDYEEPPNISSTMYYNLKQFLEKYAHDMPVPYSGRGSRFFEAIITKWQSANELLNLLDMVVQEEGENSVFTRLESHAVELNDLMSDFVRASDQSSVNACATTFATIIKGSSLTMDEAQELDDFYDDMEFE